jgi:anaerobic magnesium-protoporphyrin IX monomethyl ester cyclase
MLFQIQTDGPKKRKREHARKEVKVSHPMSAHTNKNLVYLIVPKKLDDIVVPPFTAMHLSHVLKKNGFKVKVLHIAPDEIETSVDEIVKEKPLFVGFSVFTGIYNLYAADMSKLIRKKDPHIALVWGGVHPSIMPSQCIEEDYIDYVVIKEGELAVLDLAFALKNGTSLRSTPNIAGRDEKGVFINPRRDFIKNLDEFRLDFDCVDMSKYVIESKEVIDGKETTIKEIGYYGSRGCVFECAFCYNLQYNDKKWRSFSTEVVLEDIKFLHDTYGINEVMFWDDHFFVNKFRALDILKGLSKMGIYGIGSDIRFDSFSETYLKQLKGVGIRYFLIGAESGSDRVLKFIKKGFNTSFVLEKVKLLAKYHIPTQYSFIMGLPTETREEVHQTIEFMHKIKRIHREASFTVGIYMPYPGSELFDTAVELGYEPPTDTAGWNVLDRWRNTVSLPWIDNKMVRNLRHLFAMLSWDLGKPLNWWVDYRIRRKLLKSDIDIKFLILYYNYILHRSKKNVPFSTLVKNRIKRSFSFPSYQKQKEDALPPKVVST